MNKHFHELMTKYFLGSATEEEFQEFEKLIAENEDLRREYIEQTMIETDMKSFAVEEQSSQQKPKAVKRFPYWLAAAILILAPVLFLSRPEPAVGIISSSESAAWESTQATLPGTLLRPGTFKLHTGLSTFKFNTGADVTIEAPATIEVISDMHVNILKGAVSVHVYTDEAKGFRVDTPYGHAIDHGTRFTVKIKADKKSAEFVVKEGEISLHHESGKEKWLKTKESSQMSANDLSEISKLESEGLIEPEKKSVILSSQNHEASVILNDDFSRLRRSYLLTKLQGLNSGMNRRAICAFKLDEVDLSQVEGVELSLNYIRFGDAIDLPLESEFALYGITDDQDKTAIKSEAKWGDIPQIEQAVFLEEFKIGRSQKTEKLVFNSTEVVNYIKGSKNSFIGFIVASKTKTIGLHHAFASSLNQAYSGPQLELILK